MSFMMRVHSVQSDANYNYSRITCRDCIKLPLYVDGIYMPALKLQLLKKTIKCRLENLDIGKNSDISTLKKYRDDIFLECGAESFKEIFLKTVLKDTYLGGTTTTELQNEVSTCQKIYYDRQTSIKVN